MSRTVDGLLLVDKPQGPTSHDVVDRVRRALGQRGVGHTGTLDPMASGLLLLVLGRATRLARFLPHSPKRYEGRIRFGITTDSDDVTGTVLSRHEGPLPSPGEIRDAAARLVGRFDQIPPAVSARRVGGERLYRLARSGQTVQAAATVVEVFSFDLGPLEEPGDPAFIVEVSGGTYVRSLARDLGAALGCGAALASLRRLAIGPLTVSDAVSPEELGGGASLEAAVIPLAGMPLEPPPVSLPDDPSCARFTAGLPVPSPAGPGSPELVRVLSPSKALLGIGEIRGGLLHPRVVLAST